MPIPYSLIAKFVGGLAFIAMLMLLGAHLQKGMDAASYGKKLDDQKSSFDARISEAEDAKEKANAEAQRKSDIAVADRATADQAHQAQVAALTNKADAAVAAARAGDIRLRYYVDAAAHAGSGGQLPGPGPAPSSGDGRTVAELPASIAAGLLALTGEVDDTLIPQIRLLQQTVLDDQKVCGRPAQPVALAPVGGGPSASSGALAQPPSTAPRAPFPKGADL